MTPRVSVPLANQAVADAAWAAAQTLPQFGYAELSITLRISERSVGRLVRSWVGEGRLIQVQEGNPRQRGIWKVDPAYVAKPAPVSRTVEECIWTAMRQAKSFTPRVLAASACTPEIEVTLEAAQAYCRALLASGHLAVTRKAVPGTTEAIYRLVRNTGPRPPRERRVRAVVDENTEQTIVIGGGQ